MRAHPIAALVLPAVVLPAALAIPGASTSAAAAAPAVPDDRRSLSIVVDDTEPELGQRLVARGRATPADADGARVRVTLQVRYEGRRAWKDVRTRRVEPDGRYRIGVVASTVRDRAYRVTASDVAGRLVDASGVEKVDVHTWRDLTTLTPVASSGLAEVTSVSHDGTVYPDSVSATSTDAGRYTISYALSGHCTRIRTTPVGAGAGDMFHAEIDGRPVFAESLGTGPVRGPLRHGSLLSLVVSTPGGRLPAFGTPQVLCDPDGRLG